MDNAGPVVTENDRQKSTSKSKKLAERVMTSATTTGWCFHVVVNGTNFLHLFPPLFLPSFVLLNELDHMVFLLL